LFQVYKITWNLLIFMIYIVDVFTIIYKQK
jgi:hypothetical protein